jgi:hypothetical protein
MVDIAASWTTCPIDSLLLSPAYTEETMLETHCTAEGEGELNVVEIVDLVSSSRLIMLL